MAIQLGNKVRVSYSEMEALRLRAQASGQSHWFPHTILTHDELLQAQSAAEGSKLLDILFGEVVHGDSTAREAYERGEIPMEEVLGVSRKGLDEIAAKHRDKRDGADTPNGDR